MCIILMGTFKIIMFLDSILFPENDEILKISAFIGIVISFYIIAKSYLIHDFYFKTKYPHLIDIIIKKNLPFKKV